MIKELDGWIFKSSRILLESAVDEGVDASRLINKLKILRGLLPRELLRIREVYKTTKRSESRRMIPAVADIIDRLSSCATTLALEHQVMLTDSDFEDLAKKFIEILKPHFITSPLEKVDFSKQKIGIWFDEIVGSERDDLHSALADVSSEQGILIMKLGMNADGFSFNSPAAAKKIREIQIDLIADSIFTEF